MCSEIVYQRSEGRSTDFKERIQDSLKDSFDQHGIVVAMLHQLADDLDEAQQKLYFAKSAFAAGGVLGGVLSVAGLLGIPFTCGTSAGLIVLGVSSGVAGFGTELYNRILNKQTIVKAQKQIDKLRGEENYTLDLIGEMRSTNPREFKEFLQNDLKQLMDPTYHKVLSNVLAIEDVDNKVKGQGFRRNVRARIDMLVGNWLKNNKLRGALAVTYSKLLLSAADTVSEGAKLAGLLSFVSLPFDLHTLISNSRNTMKKTPSEVAAELRTIAEELRSIATSRCQSEAQRLRKEKEQMKEEVKKNADAWDKTKSKIEEDVTMEMESLSAEYDYRTHVIKKAKIYNLICQVVLVLITVCLSVFASWFESGWVGWLRYLVVCLLALYDIYLFILYPVEHGHKIWIEKRVQTGMDKHTYAMEALFKAPPLILKTNVTTLPSNPLQIEYSNQILKQSIKDFFIISMKLCLTLYILVGLSGSLPEAALPLNQHLLEGSSDTSLMSTVLSSLMLPWGSEPTDTRVGLRMDLYILSLTIICCLLVAYIQDIQGCQQSEVSRNILGMAEHFKFKLKEMDRIMQRRVIQI